MEPSWPCDLVRSNVGMFEGQIDQMPSDEAFSSQYNSVNFLGDGHAEMDMQMDHQMLSHEQQQQQFDLEESMLLQQQLFLKWNRYFSADAAEAHLNQMQQHQTLAEMQQFQNSPRPCPQQRCQVQQQNLPIRSPIRPVTVEKCKRRIAQYMIFQRHRPEDNNIGYWRKFVKEFFTPNAKKAWCISMYGKLPPTTGVSPHRTWYCATCKRKPGRGFEASYGYLPRLFKIKYESGVLEELLYTDVPHGYYSPSGHVIVTYSTTVQHTVYEKLRIVRSGQLRILFTPDLKIRSWEFCAVKHEEVIPRRLLTSQVRELSNVVQKYHASTQNKAPSEFPESELESSSTKFMESARGIAKALQGPLLNELGYGKRYVQCLQIGEVVESMKGLIDFSLATGASPLESVDMLRGRKNKNTAEDGQSQQQQWQHAETSHEYTLQNVWKPAS